MTFPTAAFGRKIGPVHSNGRAPRQRPRPGTRRSVLMRFPRYYEGVRDAAGGTEAR